MNESSPPEKSPPAPTGPGKGSLLVIFLTVFIDLLGFGMVLPLLPLYAKHFLTKEQVWLVGPLMASFSAMQFLWAPVWGRLSDRIGRRPVLMIGLAGSVVFYTLFGLATVWSSIVWLFVARIGAGIAGANISITQAYIADTTTLENRTQGMTLIGAAFGLGFTFGPLLGGLALVGSAGAPAPWPGYVAAGLSGIALVVAWFKLPESLQPGSSTAARRLFDLRALGKALTTPSIGPLLITSFILVLAFANFETTLSLMLEGAFHFQLIGVLCTFAVVGLTLCIAQGFLVRRLSRFVPEATLATTGALLEILGFGVMLSAVGFGSVWQLFVALLIVVSGFSFVMPSLSSLLSRRSDPDKQGSILGLNQSVSALARIIGPVMAIPLLEFHVFLPYAVAAGMMTLGLVMILIAARSGKDYGPVATELGTLEI